MNTLRQLPYFLFLLLIFTCCLTACLKEEIPSKQTLPVPYKLIAGSNNPLRQIKQKGIESLCFTFSYPVWIVDPIGKGKVSVRSDEALLAWLEKWEKDNPAATDYPSLRLPFLLLQGEYTYTFVREEATFQEVLTHCEQEG